MAKKQPYYNHYCESTVPLRGLGYQIKAYLDKKFDGLADDEKLDEIANQVAEMGTNLTNTVNTSITNLQTAVTNTLEGLPDEINAHTDTVGQRIICNNNCVSSNALCQTKCAIETAKTEIIDAIGENATPISEINESITNASNNIVSAVETIAGNVEKNLSGAITTSADNVVKATETIAANIEKNLSGAITTSADNVVKSAEVIATNAGKNIVDSFAIVSDDAVKKVNNFTLEIAGNVENNLSNAITTSADNVVKANEQIASTIEKNLTGAITTSGDNVAKVVRDEAKAARENLIAQLSTTNDLVKSGFSDLNTSIIANKEDAVMRINRVANANKVQIIDAINEKDIVPFDVYGGSVLNSEVPGVNSMDEAKVKALPMVHIADYNMNVVFSIKIQDVAVSGMNDDATGVLYSDAMKKNARNIAFSYPAKYLDTIIYDAMGMNVTSSFEMKNIQVGGMDYTVAVMPVQLVNLYDPKWEKPSDYTLNYTLVIGE